MNVYDFDETIYMSDCSRDFCMEAYRRYPRVWLYVPKQLAALWRYMTGAIDKKTFKEQYFSMFAAISDMDRAVNDFWDRHIDQIFPYYQAQKRPDDLVISASPRFLVEPACRRLGLDRVLASEVDPATGHFYSDNCYGEEKVRRFMEAGYRVEDVEAFYSDSCSDDPLAQLAQEAHIVTHKGLADWKRPRQKGMQAFFTLFNKREALLSLLAGLAAVAVSGHIAKYPARQGLPAGAALAGTSALTGGGIIGACLALGRRKALWKKVAKCLSRVLPAVFTAQACLAAGLAAVLGAPVAALALTTLAGIPMLYVGVRWVFRSK
jgi:phosphatidylglycerophosphatase C